jgi:hypothetical protein
MTPQRMRLFAVLLGAAMGAGLGGTKGMPVRGALVGAVFGYAVARVAESLARKSP